MTGKVVFIVNGTESAQGTNPMANRGPVGRDRENTGRRIPGTVSHTEMYRNNGPWWETMYVHRRQALPLT